MNPNRRTSVHLAACAAFASGVFLAGCGGGSGGSSSTHSATAASASASTNPSTATTTATHTSASPAPSRKHRRARRGSRSVVAARVIGTHALLRLADLPAGFLARPRSEEGSPATIQRRIAGCLRVPVSELREHDPREVKSPKFKGPAGVTVSNSVTVLGSEPAARRYLAIVEEPQAPACIAGPFGQAFARGLAKAVRSGRLPAGVRLGQVSAARLSVPRAGAQSVAMRIQIPLTGPGGSIAVTFDAMVLRAGGAVASLTFAGERGPVSRSLEQSLSSLVAARLAAVPRG